MSEFGFNRNEFEKENGEPENWMSNFIFVKDGRGRIVKLEIPDDSDAEDKNEVI